MKKTLLDDSEEDLRLYAIYSDEADEDGTFRIVRPIAYAYGAPWVAQALYMDDLKFDTPEEAKEWWDKNYGEKEQKE